MRKPTSVLVLAFIILAGCADKAPEPAMEAAPELLREEPAALEAPELAAQAADPAPQEQQPQREPKPDNKPRLKSSEDLLVIGELVGDEGGADPGRSGGTAEAYKADKDVARSPRAKRSKRTKGGGGVDGFAMPKLTNLDNMMKSGGAGPDFLVPVGGEGERRQTNDSRTKSRKKKRVERKERSIRPPTPRPVEDIVEIEALPEPEEVFEGFENQVVETTTEVKKDAIDTRVDPKSTFSIDVDTGGYTLARARLREGYRPKPEDVRIEEFLNYFHYDYPAPVDSTFSIHMESAPNPFSQNPRNHLLRIGVQGKEVPSDARPPAHLTFLVDVSGSMFGPDRLGLIIEALDLVTRNLRPDDTIAVVTYAMGAEVALWPAGAQERDIAAAAIARLEPGGSSDLDEGLSLAYEVAATHFTAGEINRVVVLGDGRANVGRTTPEALLASVRSGVEDGVMLSTIGFGAKAFNDRLMEQLADRGNGNYFFVDSYHEATRVFRDRLCGTIFAIANDVKIQVEFNPESVKTHRLLGYENRRLEHQQFRDDKVDAGEIGAGHSVTAIYELELQPKLDETIATVGVRFKDPGSSAASELNYSLFSRELREDVREASQDFKFAAAVALFAQIAKGDEPGGADRLSLIREIATEGVIEGEQPDRKEFVSLVAEAAPFYSRD